MGASSAVLTCSAGFPAGEDGEEWQPGLLAPPESAEALDRFAERVAPSRLAFRLLGETAH